MRVPATTSRGPRSSTLRRPPGRVDSHNPWTKRRGPVKKATQEHIGEVRSNCLDDFLPERSSIGGKDGLVDHIGEVSAVSGDHLDRGSKGCPDRGEQRRDRAQGRD